MTNIAPTVTTDATDFGAISSKRGIALGDASGRHAKREVELGNDAPTRG